MLQFPVTRAPRNPQRSPVTASRRVGWWGALGLLLSACSPRPPATAEPIAAAPPCDAPSCPERPLYGFWGINGYVSAEGLDDLKARFGLSVFHTATISPEHALEAVLPLARSAGVRVTLRMTGDHVRYTTPEGDFDRDAWEAMLAPWGGSGVRPYIDDGTLFGHMLLDDISNFEGRDPDAADLEEMARYSEALLPGLMTFVRQKASAMPTPASGRYEHVDAVVNQYKAAEGDVEDYAVSEARRAAALGLGIINGLNIANGGDGSSAKPGWGEGRYAMSAEEIVRYGAVLAAVPGCGMFLNWEYDAEERWASGAVGSDYFDQSALQRALADVGEQVSARQPVRLSRP